MHEIPYVIDPYDETGSRCENLTGLIRCHRRKGHSSTRVLLPKDNSQDPDVFVTFNHRGRAGQRYFTW